jgi:hypothetical protein
VGQWFVAYQPTQASNKLQPLGHLHEHFSCVLKQSHWTHTRGAVRPSPCSKASPTQETCQGLSQGAHGRSPASRENLIPIPPPGKRRPPTASRNDRASLAHGRSVSRSAEDWTIFARERSGPQTRDVPPWSPAMVDLPKLARDDKLVLNRVYCRSQYPNPAETGKGRHRDAASKPVRRILVQGMRESTERMAARYLAAGTDQRLNLGGAGAMPAFTVGRGRSR